MTLRLKLRGDKKAMIRFGDQLEEQWFVNLMRSIRDGDPRTHPIISIKDKGGEIPRLPPPKTMPLDKEGKPINVSQKLTPEMIKKLEIQQPMRVQPPVKGKPIPPEILEKMKMEKVKK